MKWGYPFSLNFLLWGSVGLWRYLTEERTERNHPGSRLSRIRSYEKKIKTVAVCLPAKNEAAIIQKTINSIKRVVPAGHCFVVSDGSTDATAIIAKRNGCRVLALSRSRGKARALQYLIKKFRLLSRFQYILIVDADTRIPRHHLQRALPLFDDPRVACVATSARTRWRRHRSPRWRYFWSGYRYRLYRILQLFLMYGQTWPRANVLTVVPGFAALYRTNVLRQLKINVPGLIIEDFNLTFQVHKKKLGLIAHRPSVLATTQDPTSLREYFKQVRRWNLGFFQTLKHYGVWPSLFSLTTIFFTLETLLAAAFFVFLPVLAFFLVLQLTHPTFVSPSFWRIAAFVSSPSLTIWDLAVAVLLVDYLLTVYIALKDRKPILLFYGLGFLFVRILDSLILLTTIPLALFTRSSGVWVSPKRV